MCGIAGIVTTYESRPEKEIKKMAERLSHRGPDDGGFHYFKRCALAHRRLTIIDKSGGAQPMLSTDGGTAITFNGEIYGYQELKKTLPYYFKTASDTEVILALYETQRDVFPQNLPGMFSFAIWDEKRQELIAARDRMGEKPFYYAFGKNGEFIFASEIKGILASGLIEPTIDLEMVSHYLRFLYVHPAKTIYKNIFNLPPAHTLTLKNGAVEIKSYWSPPHTDNSDITLNDAANILAEKLRTAVKKQLVADVPVGAFLSGGLDSSTITALATEVVPNINTFSFGFGPSRNELPFAREIAKKLGTTHTELTPDEHTDLSDLLIRMQDVYDEPFADSSNIPTFMLSQLAKKHTTVVLTGDGADELLAGYTHWYSPLLYFKNNPSQSEIFSAYIAFHVSRLAGLKNTQRNMHRLSGLRLGREHQNIFGAHYAQMECFSESTISMILPDTGKKETVGHPFEKYNALDTVLRHDLSTYLPGDILVKTDRASMAHGLELRSPFLDTAVVEFCVGLPNKLKINKREDKIVLRQAFQNLWTDAIRKRKKQGFGAPVANWLTRPEFKELISEYLNNPRKKIFDLISFEKSRKICSQGDYQTWTLLILSLWLERN